MPAARGLELGQKLCADFRLPPHRTQDVEADHIARALPDGIERRLAIDPRHHALFNVASAAMGFHRLIGEVRTRLLIQYLPIGVAMRAKPASPPCCLVEAAGNAKGERGRGLGLDDQVGQHARMSGWSMQLFLERDAMGGVPQRVGQRLAHDAAGATMQSSRVCCTISMMVLHAAALLADDVRA